MNDGPLRVAAEPYVGKERQKATFGRSLDDAGIIPVLLLIENASDHPVLLRRAWISLDTAGESRSAEESASRADTLLRGEHLQWNKAVGAYGGLGYRTVDVGIGYLLGAAFRQKEKPPDPSQWQLPATVTLTPEERVRGFVYFGRPRGDTQSTGDILRIEFSESETRSQPEKRIELQLRGGRAQDRR